MAFRFTINAREGQLVNEIMVYAIASAAYNGIKGMSFIKRADSVTFSHEKDMPIEEYAYLLMKYNHNISVEVETA